MALSATFRSSSNGSTGAGTASSVTVSLPAGVTYGDVMLAAVHIDGGTSSTVNDVQGWTRIGDIAQTTNARGVIFWRLYDGSDPSSYTWTFDSARSATILIVAYSGAYPQRPTQIVNANSATPNTTYTPFVSNSVWSGKLVNFFMTRNTTGVNDVTPGGAYIERAETANAASPFMGIESQEFNVGLPVGGLTASAATGTVSSTFMSWSMFLPDRHGMALRPTIGLPVVDELGPASRTTLGNNLQPGFWSTRYANTLVVALFEICDTATTISTVTNTSGLTWNFIARSNTQTGSCEAWYAWAAKPIFSQTVTATTAANFTVGNACVVPIVGADDTNGNGSSAIGATATANSGVSSNVSVGLTTTRNNSLVLGCFNNPTTTSIGTILTTNTNFRSLQNATSAGVNFWVSAPLASGATATLGTSTALPSWNALAIEILGQPNLRTAAGTRTLAGTRTAAGTRNSIN